MGSYTQKCHAAWWILKICRTSAMDTTATMNSITPTAATSLEQQPDPDTIKMFVGQVPRSMDENELRKMFEEFGPVYQLNILRDRQSGQSKGCCFVTFLTRKAALAAQNELHNIKTMPGMHHPIQMKPADSETRSVEERKLFIGMLSKKYNENDVRLMFAPYGTIEDCTVLRDQSGNSRGCAFVTFSTRQSALNAIKTMHHSNTLEGCSSPLVAKFADTQKEKDAKRLHQQMTTVGGISSIGGALWGGVGGAGSISTPSPAAAMSGLGPQYLALMQQAAAGGNVQALSGIQQLANLNTMTVPQLAALASAVNQQSSGGNTTTSSPFSGLSSTALLNAVSQLQQQQAALASTSQASSSGSAATPTCVNSQSHHSVASTGLGSGLATGLQTLAGSTGQTPLTGGNGSGNPTANGTSLAASLQGLGTSGLAGGIGGVTNAINSLGTASLNGVGSANLDMNALTQAYSGIQQYAAQFPNGFGSISAFQQQNTPSKQKEGPEGANLFIYHLPQEFGDQDLLQTFSPFGNVISAKVFIDKQTNLSKCFGFVSYDNPVSAQAAIQSMNGFQIGMKRLKVQLKRSKEASKPY